MKTYTLFINKLRYAVVAVLFIALFSCESNEEVDPVEEILPPIVLDCDYFNTDQVLINDPDRPVDYIIECWARVEGSLQIQPGVVIAFENHAGLYVDLDNSLFEIQGTVQEPVVLTGTSAQKGFWRGIYLTEAHNPNNLIEHTVIEYAGSQNLTGSSPIYEGSLAIRGVSGTTPQALTLNHVEIINGGSIGLDFHRIEPNATVATSNLTISGNEGVPVKVSAVMADVFDNTSTYVGNSSDFINITTDHGTLDDMEVSLQKLDVPYLVDGRILVSDEAHLTIEAGVEMQFKSSGYLQVSGDNVSLKIQGTDTEQVLLTAENGTNWGGIYYGHTQDNNSIDHAIIEYAKGDFPVGNLSNSGAIYMHANPRVSVSNTTFKDLPNFAFYAYTGASVNEPELPNLSLSNITYTNVVGGELGWGNGRN
ncbi:hypothetical protein [Algoriphagus sp. Y33]|uniref:hypothetical protein n=1 Tax=Algoriphagus sp. Y33 TaxID=2772483 RepID=UPI00177AB9D3|nr:hypothetical protein [Algoriphagus sp. Y33]